MIVLMKAGIAETGPEVRAVVARAEELGLLPQIIVDRGAEFSAVQVNARDGHTRAATIAEHVFRMDGVADVLRVTPPQVTLTNSGTHGKQLELAPGIVVGNGTACRLVAGPCTVDRHVHVIAERLAGLGIAMFRGGCWKPRSRPGSFTGHGETGVRWLLEAARSAGMKAVFTEVMESHQIGIIRRVRDAVGFAGTIVLWVGARTQNTILLEALGAQREFPVMVKNSLHAAGVQDLYDRAEWVLAGPKVWLPDGSLDPHRSLKTANERLILCLRGIEKRDARAAHRFDPNSDWIETLRRDKVWAPICVDPSHSAGTRELVPAHLKLALAHHPNLVMVEGGYAREGPHGLCDQSQTIFIEDMPSIVAMVEDHNATRSGERVH